MSQHTPTGRTYIVVAPHPDDEHLRASGAVNDWVHNGHRAVLLGLTDGGATHMGVREGLPRHVVEERRRAEQIGCWSALTYGMGQRIHAGLPDGALRYDDALAAIKNALELYPGAEVYAACHPLDDPKTSPDHVVAWQACRDSGAAVVRYLKNPEYGGGATGTHYPQDLQACEDATAAYWWTLGPRSTVGSIRNKLVSTGFMSRYTR